MVYERNLTTKWTLQARTMDLWLGLDTSNASQSEGSFLDWPDWPENGWSMLLKRRQYKRHLRHHLRASANPCLRLWVRIVARDTILVRSVLELSVWERQERELRKRNLNEFVLFVLFSSPSLKFLLLIES